MKVLIYIACYNAEKRIYEVLKRIPPGYRNDPNVKILISDDCSQDKTAETALGACRELGYSNFEIFRTKINQGYGGNQKIGYSYGCSNDFDYVIHLPGNGEYPPEELDNFFKLFKEKPDMVIGASMLKNRFPGQEDFPESYTGYRAFSTDFLKEVPFELNANSLDFDADILTQAKFLEKKIKKFPITVSYGQKKSRARLIKDGLGMLRAALRYKLQLMGIGCSIKFKGSKQLVYKDKFGYKFTSHYYLLETIKKNKPKRILEIASGAGYLGERLKNEGAWLAGIDLFPPKNKCYDAFFCENIEEFDWNRLPCDHFDMVCLMDILEHLKDPEKLLLALRSNPKTEGAVFVISVPNVAFFSIRLGLLLGIFNYADRGILDTDHKRLFTYRSIHSILKECGFKVNQTIPVPPAFKSVCGGLTPGILTGVFNLLNKVLPGLFSFQIMKIATALPASTSVINKFLDRYK